MATPIFDYIHPKFSGITSSFLEFAPECKKMNSFNLFILEKKSVLESHDQIGHTISDHANPKILLSTFNLCKYVSTCKKSDYFIDLF